MKDEFEDIFLDWIKNEFKMLYGIIKQKKKLLQTLEDPEQM